MEDQWYALGLYQLNKIIPMQYVFHSNCSEWIIIVLGTSSFARCRAKLRRGSHIPGGAAAASSGVISTSEHQHPWSSEKADDSTRR